MELVPVEVVEKLIVEGDLSKLSPAQRVAYYRALCQKMGLDPLARPMDYLWLDGKLVLYLNKGGADQLRRRLGARVRLVERRVDQELGVIIVTVEMEAGDQCTPATGVVPIKVPVYGYQDGKKVIVNWRDPSPAELANAIMRAETKAIRRGTLALGALGVTLAEEELDTIEPSRVQVVSAEVIEDQAAGGEEGLPAPKEPLVGSREPLAGSREPLAGSREQASRNGGQAPHGGGQASEYRQRLLIRLQELLESARALGLRRWNPAHLANHLRSHYQAEKLDDLTDDQIIELGRTIKGELEEAQKAQASHAPYAGGHNEGQAQPSLEISEAG